MLNTNHSTLGDTLRNVNYNSNSENNGQVTLPQKACDDYNESYKFVSYLPHSAYLASNS